MVAARTFRRCHAFVVIAMLVPGVARAQSAADGFNPNADGAVRAIATLADGRMIVGGEFSALGGMTRQYIGRINIDGSIDQSFSPVINGTVRAIAVQTDGRVVIGGDFSTVSGAARPSLVRLNADGSVDESFAASVSGSVLAMAIQADGKVVVGGAGFVARLHANGNADTGFAASVDGAVLAIAVQQNERVVLGGEFTGHLKRVLPDGTTDGSFTTSAAARVRALALRVDGTLVAASDDGLIVGGAGSVASNGAVHALVFQPDGTWVAAGEFTEIGGGARNRIARFGRSGQLDTAFTAGADGPVFVLARQPDGSIVTGGAFTHLSRGGTEVARASLGRLTASGFIDADFNPGANNTVVAMAVQADGKVLVGGLFTSLGGTRRNYLGRLNADGSLDAGFNPGANDAVLALAVQHDGRILVGGAFTTIGGGGTGATSRLRLARLNQDGSIDPTFDAEANNQVNAIAMQRDGAIVVGGQFTTLNGVMRRRLGRVDADGALDVSFDPGVDNPVHTVAVDPDGRILVGGAFTMLGGGGMGNTDRAFVGRLNADGTLDTAFDPGADGDVYALALDSAGRILVGGAFTMLGGGGMGATARSFLGRLHASGVVDEGFNPGADGDVHAIATEPEGAILIGGAFAHVGASPRYRLARLGADGAVDATFNPGANNTVFALAHQADGRVLAGGAFTALGGGGTGAPGRSKLGRLTSSAGATQELRVTNVGRAMAWTRGGALSEIASATLDVSFDGETFAPAGVAAWSEGTWELDAAPLPVNQRVLVRARGAYSSGHHNGSSSVAESLREVFFAMPSIVASPLSSATIGVPLSVAFSTTGALGVVSFTSAGPLPSGLSLSASGVLSGAPQALGAFPISLRATDASSGCVASADLTLTVGCPAILLSATSFATGITGSAYTPVVVTASGGLGATNFTVIAGQLPEGLSLSNSGVISGTPTQPGTFAFTIRGTDVNGCFGAREYVMEVRAAPVVITQPLSQTVTAGGSVVFAASASGSPAPTYQWQMDAGAGWSALANSLEFSGVQTTSLVVSNVPAAFGGRQFRVVATNSVASVASSLATLTVHTAPVVTSHPASPTIVAGATATFTVAATSNPSPTYRWQVLQPGGGWADVGNANGHTGASTSTLTFANAAGSHSGNQYRAVIGNGVGSVISNAAVLTVHTSPAISAQPVDRTIVAGGSTTFTVSASGNPAPTYRWQLLPAGNGSWSDVPQGSGYSGGLTATLNVSSVSAALAGVQYRVVVGNVVGAVTSTAALLTIHTAPSISAQPADRTVVAGATATFTVSAVGHPTPAYQWQISSSGGANWSDLGGATGSSGVSTAMLSLANVSAAHSGNQYRVVVTNSVGAVTSSAALLTVHTVPVISMHPVDRTVVAGSAAVFSAAATGNPAPTYRWEVSTTNGAVWDEVSNAAFYSGASTATLTVSNVDASLSGKWFRVVASNGAGSSASSAAVLGVQTAPTFLSPPGDQITVEGNTASFTVLANGAPAPTYRWQVSTTGGSSWSDLASSAIYTGVTSTLLILNNVPASLSGGRYRAIASNSVASVASAAGLLTVYTAPTIVLQPVDRVVTAGATTTFTASANGTPTPVLRWQVMPPGGSSWSNVSDAGVYAGATSGVLTLSGVTAALGGGRYRLVATNSVTSVSSSSATLTVNVSPSITSSPADRSVDAGQSASFSVVVSGSPSPSITWQESSNGTSWSDVLNAAPYAGAATSTLTIAPAPLGLTGRRVRAVATNVAGTATSGHATLTVNPVSDPRMALESPVQGASVETSFALSGWAIDLGAPSGVGIDNVQVDLVALSEGAVVATYAAAIGGARPDIGEEFGGRFANAGFSLALSSVAPGAYRVVVRARSVVTGTFVQAQSVDIAVVAPSPQPFMALDAPAPGATVKRSFDVSGWAVDMGAITGTGVDAVHVWMTPLVDGVAGAAVFVGAATVGAVRPDISTALGSRFAPSGFGLRATGITPGTYRLTVFAHSTVSGTFNQSMSADITVLTPVSHPAMALDAPTGGSTVSSPFSVRGWAVDLGADSDPGVGVVHVWAFPFVNGALGPGVFVGVPTYGLPRPDLGAALGSYFTNCGFSLNTASLTPGSYRLVVFAFSTIAGAFNQSLSADIVVTAVGSSVIEGASSRHDRSARYVVFVDGKEIAPPDGVESPVNATAGTANERSVVWLGDRDGVLHVTHDGNAVEPRWWTTTPPGMAGVPVRAVAIDPINPDVVVAAFDGAAQLWKTRDGGRTWRSLRGVLPAARDLVVRAVAIDPETPSRMYVGTNRGLFASRDAGETWTASGPEGHDIAQLIWNGSRLIVVTHAEGVSAVDDERKP